MALRCRGNSRNNDEAVCGGNEPCDEELDSWKKRSKKPIDEIVISRCGECSYVSRLQDHLDCDGTFLNESAILVAVSDKYHQTSHFCILAFWYDVEELVGIQNSAGRDARI